MDDNRRTLDLKSNSNGEQQQSKSLASPSGRDSEDNNNSSIRKSVQTRNKDLIFQKATEIVCELSKHQIQYYPNIPLNDRTLLAICLVASDVSNQDPNLVEYLKRCGFGSDLEDLGVLQTSISSIEYWGTFPLSRPSNNEIQMLEPYLKQIRFLLQRL